MKKTIFVIAATAFIALVGTQAFACFWDRYWNRPVGGPTAGVYDGHYQEFHDKTSDFRQDLAAKQGEYNTLLATSNPDPKRAAELNREITVLHDQLSAQARSFNLPPVNSGHYGRMGGCGWCW